MSTGTHIHPLQCHAHVLERLVACSPPAPTQAAAVQVTARPCAATAAGRPPALPSHTGGAVRVLLGEGGVSHAPEYVQPKAQRDMTVLRKSAGRRRVGLWPVCNMKPPDPTDRSDCSSRRSFWPPSSFCGAQIAAVDMPYHAQKSRRACPSRTLALSYLTDLQAISC